MVAKNKNNHKVAPSILSIQISPFIPFPLASSFTKFLFATFFRSTYRGHDVIAHRATPRLGRRGQSRMCTMQLPLLIVSYLLDDLRPLDFNGERENGKITLHSKLSGTAPAGEPVCSGRFLISSSHLASVGYSWVTV